MDRQEVQRTAINAIITYNHTGVVDISLWFYEKIVVSLWYEYSKHKDR